MAYIGRYVGTDKTTKTVRLDTIEAQFTGAQTVFSLSADQAAVYPSTAQSLLISLNGVIQEPGTAYTISENHITFASAPAANSEFFGVLNGAPADFGYNFGQLNVSDVATFSSNVTVLGTLTVGNSTITINTTTLLVGNATSNVSVNSTAIVIGSTTVNATGLAATNAANTSANGVVTTGTQSFAGDKTFVNTVTVTGNLTVLGTTVTLNSENVLIKDNIITLSSNVTGSPVLDAGIEVNRGTSANVTLKWNETSDVWQTTTDGTNYGTLLTTLSTTDINASALSTGTVPLARLSSANTTANGVVDTTTQTFAGNKTFQNATSFSNTVSITGAVNALSTLGVTGTFTALGLSTLTGNATFSGSRTFFASGSVLDWNSGDVTITHSANTLTFGGASSGYVFSDGPIMNALGAAGTPSYTFSGDLNTGIFSSAADTLNLSTGGSERMRIDSSGNVGIGTTSPTNKFEVNGNGVRIAAQMAANTSSVDIEAQVQNYWSGTGGPTYTGTAISQYGSAATGTSIGLSNANLGILRFQNGSAGLIYTNGMAPIVFATLSTERMRIDSSGNVGIGVTPKTFTSGKAVEIGAAGNIAWGNGGGDLFLASNLYYNTDFKYALTNAIAAARLQDGSFKIFTAPSGTADTTATLTERFRVFNGGNLAIGATARIYLDGVAGTGDTYIEEIVSNNIRFVAGGNNIASFGLGGTSAVEFFGDLRLQATKKLFLDSGGDTYLHESAANQVQLIVGGNTKMQASKTDISVSTATTILSDAGGLGAFVVVNGNDGSNRFCDLVLASTSTAPTVVASYTALGSPAARTYTRSGGALQLAMASGTYTVNTVKLGS